MFPTISGHSSLTPECFFCFFEGYRNYDFLTNQQIRKHIIGLGRLNSLQILANFYIYSHFSVEVGSNIQPLREFNEMFIAVLTSSLMLRDHLV